jgi:hypothetical protein
MRRLFGVASLMSLALLGSTIPLKSQEGAAFVRSYDADAIGAPRTIVSADFNRDGFPDIALGGTGRASVGILLHHGLEDGDEGQRFKPLREIVVGGGPFDMAVGDLNRDGLIDIAVANADANDVTLLFNDATHQFSRVTHIPIGENPRGIAIADFNRDGKPDIIATKFVGTTAQILYGAGDGTYPTGVLVTVPEGSQGVATGDFNADGWTDWVAVSYAGVAQFGYMGPSGLIKQQQIPLGTNLNVVTTGDFDKNGWLDIAVASTSGSTVELVLRTADPAVFTTSSHSVASSPRGIESADLNNDGWLDIVVAGRNTSSVSVLTRTSDGGYVDTQYGAGMGARDVTLVDFTQDARVDILTANEYANATTLLMNAVPKPTAAFAFDRVKLPMQWDLRAFGVADFNSNGIPDVVLREGIYLDMKTMSRRFLDAYPDDGTIGDFNGDGRTDIVFASTGPASNYRPALRVFFGTGTGDVTTGPVMLTGAMNAGQMRTADMNRDGRLDLVMRLADGLHIWLGRGDGTFGSATIIPVATSWLEVADINRDGALDVLATTSGGVQTFLGDGTGRLTASAVFSTDGFLQGFALGDMTQDGILDLVVVEAQKDQYGSRIASAVVTARGRGDGGFDVHSRTAVIRPTSWSNFSALLLADLDNDGALDVMTGNGNYMQGAWNLMEPQLFAVAGSVRMHAVDMNQDGLLDIVGVGHDRNVGDSPNMIMLNTRRTRAENQAPVGITLGDTVQYWYSRIFSDEDEPEMWAGFELWDPDLHHVSHRWALADGTVKSTHPVGYAPGPEMTPGRYPMSFSLDDGRGGVTTRNFTLEIVPYKEAVLLAGGDSVPHGAWQLAQDSSANQGYRLWLPNANAPKIVTPLAEPTDYVDIAFLADPTQEYKLWVRMKAEGDDYANDSVHVQFSGATDAAGNPIYRIGTTSGLAVNLEECANCGISGWGWEDDGWGAVNTNGVTLRFPEGGRQKLRIQAREDGVSLDTIVLSAEKYKTTRPGTAKNDNTRLNPTGPWLGTWWFDR